MNRTKFQSTGEKEEDIRDLQVPILLTSDSFHECALRKLMVENSNMQKYISQLERQLEEYENGNTEQTLTSSDVLEDNSIIVEPLNLTEEISTALKLDDSAGDEGNLFT